MTHLHQHAGDNLTPLSCEKEGTTLFLQNGILQKKDTRFPQDVSVQEGSLGFELTIPAQKKIQKPFLFFHQTVPKEKEPMLSIAHTFVAESESSMTLIDIHQKDPIRDPFAIRSTTDLLIEANAHVTYYHIHLGKDQVQEEQVLNIQLQKNSRLDLKTFSFGGESTTNTINITFEEEGGTANVQHLSLLSGEQSIKNTLMIHHKKPHCSSTSLYKGIFDDASTGSFSGNILVEKQAKKTEASQWNKNILLSPNAKMHTEPQLTIRNHDVLCRHGATSGQLDEEALLYLRSRGIPLAQAIQILTSAFAEECLASLEVPFVKIFLRNLIQGYLAEK